MPGQDVLNTANQAVKASGPPAVITAGIGVGATGIAGQGIETKTDPIASGAAQRIGVDPQLGPLLLFVVVGLMTAVTFVVPGLVEDH